MISYLRANVSPTKGVKMPLAGVSLLLLAVLMVEIQAQWIPDNGVTFLGQSGLRSETQLQTGHPWSNPRLLTSSSSTNGVTRASFLQQLQSVPLQSITASSTSSGSISTVDHELLGPNEGIGHNSPRQFQNVFSETVSDSSRDNPPDSPYSLPGRISPVRGPNGEVFRITGDEALPLIVPNRFNRLPRLGGNGDAVTSTGEYINTLSPRPRNRRGRERQFRHSFGPDN